jgi:hypothetical protein
MLVVHLFEVQKLFDYGRELIWTKLTMMEGIAGKAPAAATASA